MADHPGNVVTNSSGENLGQTAVDRNLRRIPRLFSRVRDTFKADNLTTQPDQTHLPAQPSTLIRTGDDVNTEACATSQNSVPNPSSGTSGLAATGSNVNGKFLSSTGITGQGTTAPAAHPESETFLSSTGITGQGATAPAAHPETETSPGPAPVVPTSAPGPSSNSSGRLSVNDNIVCWDGVYVRRERSDASLPWTWAQSNLSQYIDREIADYIQGRCSNQTVELEYCLELLFAGKQPHVLHPAIVISTRSRKTKKQISHCLARSELKHALRVNKLNLYVLKTPIEPAAGPFVETSASMQHHALTEPPKHIPLLSGTEIGYQPWRSGQILLNDCATSLCGALILIKDPSSELISHCVLGGSILVGNSAYAYTALHPFARIRIWESNQEGEDDACESNADSEDTDDDEPFCILYDDGSEQDNAVVIPSAFPASFSISSTIQQSSQWQSACVSSKKAKNGSLNIFEMGFQQRLSGELSLWRQGPDADWALFDATEIERSSGSLDVVSPNTIGGHVITECFDEQEASVPVILALPTGEVPGSLHPGSALYRLGSRLYDLRLVTLEEPLKPGCSGAWVACGNELCGSITVVRPDCPWIYIMPFSTIKKNMEEICGFTVRFPLMPSLPPRSGGDAPSSPVLSVASIGIPEVMPSLSRANSDDGSSSADTDLANSILGDGHVLESQDGILTVPFRYQEDANLLCPFQILDCDRVFTNIIQFKTHVFSHFRGHELPTAAACFLCDAKFTQHPEDDRALAWNTMLSHMVHEHYRQGQQLATVRTDFSLMRWMFSKRLITKEQFSRTQMVPMPIILPGGSNARAERGKFAEIPQMPSAPAPPTLSAQPANLEAGSRDPALGSGPVGERVSYTNTT
ncbi:hypothetical protein LTR84_005682 [Exophiala bonariae]|uniref:C2H2-type domain-containing protein n=1 Tax=Exophiala bonariae TaxID=1690606 RepID=A0AAV9N3W7_9EURO|nr:hypothetical protein LTR84_005682 [Exophiala bonariae]